jgi:hypothetical protein
MRHDALVLRFDPGKELENETPRAELIADQSRGEGVLAVKVVDQAPTARTRQPSSLSPALPKA